MSQPVPPMVVIADIARETTQVAIQLALTEVQAAIAVLTEKVDTLMSEDATVAAEVAAEEADIGKLTVAVGSMQDLIVALQAEVTAGALTPATMAALAKVQTDLAAVRGVAEADVIKDIPPSGA